MMGGGGGWGGGRIEVTGASSQSIYSYFEKGCRKKSVKVHVTIPKGSLGHSEYDPDYAATLQ